MPRMVPFVVAAAAAALDHDAEQTDGEEIAFDSAENMWLLRESKRKKKTTMLVCGATHNAG